MGEEGTVEEGTVSFELYFWFPQKQYKNKPRSWEVLERGLCGHCVQMLLGHLGQWSSTIIQCLQGCGFLDTPLFCDEVLSLSQRQRRCSLPAMLSLSPMYSSKKMPSDSQEWVHSGNHPAEQSLRMMAVSCGHLTAHLAP